MNNMYEALEICLQDIEQGADIETVLFRYPDLAEELRPILEAAAGAKSMAMPAPSAEVVRRNRAKVLQHAAQMREARVKSSRRLWFASLRRFAVTLAVLTVLFVSGTGLVGASSNTLPGDNLYPVKRTWEGVRLFFTFNGQDRQALELEHENERLHELNELLQEGRSEEVDFNGLVTSQSENEWVVAGVRVLISSQTRSEQGIAVGSPVRVRGITQRNGTILAERIQLLSPNAVLPDVEEHESEEVDQDNSGPGSGTEQPNVEETETPGLENENSGSHSGSNENQNENSNENENGNSNENSGSGNENNENNENGGNDNENVSNENGNENGNQENNNTENEQENENNSGGEENNNSGGGESGGED